MAGSLRPGVSVLLLVCFISQTYCQLEAVKVLNHADDRKYQDCGSLMKAGYNVSGVYRLTLGGNDVQIPCEFVGGKAYSVIVRRVSNALSFIQPWSVYRYGFGHPTFNYWAGLEKIHLLILGGQNKLHISMQDCNNTSVNLYYLKISLGNEATRYQLQVNPNDYRGPPGLDDLTYNSGMPFSTYDLPDPNGCARNIKAGWWYNYCTLCLPTGKYYIGGHYTPPGRYYDGIFWASWRGFNYSLKSITMTLYS